MGGHRMSHCHNCPHIEHLRHEDVRVLEQIGELAKDILTLHKKYLQLELEIYELKKNQEVKHA